MLSSNWRKMMLMKMLNSICLFCFLLVSSASSLDCLNGHFGKVYNKNIHKDVVYENKPLAGEDLISLSKVTCPSDTEYKCGRVEFEGYIASSLDDFSGIMIGLTN